MGGTALGVKTGTVTFLVLKFDDARFFREFAEKNVLVICYGDGVQKVARDPPASKNLPVAACSSRSAAPLGPVRRAWVRAA